MRRWLRQQSSLLLLGALALLLSALALLQYRWTSEIGRAEAERRRAQIERSSAAFASTLGREFGQILAGFRLEPGATATEQRRLLLMHLEAMRSKEASGLVTDAWLASRDREGRIVLEHCPPGGSEFAPSPWPPRLAFLHELAAEIGGGGARPANGSLRGREPPLWRLMSLHDPPPMLVVPLLDTAHEGVAAAPGGRWMRLVVAGLAVVELNDGHLRERLLPHLAEQHFGPLAGSELVVAVLRRDDGSVVYSSASDLTPAELKRADVQFPLLGLARPVAFSGGDRRGRETFAAGAGAFGGFAFRAREPGEPAGPGRGAPRAGMDEGPLPAGEGGLIVQFGGGVGGDPARRTMPPVPFPFESGPTGAWSRRGPDQPTPWLLAVRHRGGSLEQAVARLARRNLAIGLAVLALLGAAAVLLVSSAQRARRLARQQLEFVAGVTHELNTPLAGIRSAGQNLSAGIVTEPAKVRRYGEMIEQEGRRLSMIVAQVLDFAGIESGRRAYASDSLSLASLVDDVVVELRLALEQAGVGLERELPADLPAVRGDAVALRRVLANLLTNALKFAAAGKSVRLRAEGRADRGTVLLRVEDHGPGIPTAERERVFEPFYRGSAAQRNHAPGSGLGLSLVRRVVRAHGGRVWIEEPADGGTAVLVELPIAEAAAGARA